MIFSSSHSKYAYTGIFSFRLSINYSNFLIFLKTYFVEEKKIQTTLLDRSLITIQQEGQLASVISEKSYEECF